jgi:hypothetical protein
MIANISWAVHIGRSFADPFRIAKMRAMIAIPDMATLATITASETQDESTSGGTV